MQGKEQPFSRRFYIHIYIYLSSSVLFFSHFIFEVAPVIFFFRQEIEQFISVFFSRRRFTSRRKEKNKKKKRQQRSTVKKRLILVIASHLFDCRLQNTNIVSGHTGIFFNSFIVNMKIKVFSQTNSMIETDLYSLELLMSVYHHFFLSKNKCGLSKILHSSTVNGVHAR